MSQYFLESCAAWLSSSESTNKMDVSTGWKLLWVALGAGALVTLKSAFVQGLAVTGKVRSSAAIAQHPGAALLKLEVRSNIVGISAAILTSLSTHSHSHSHGHANSSRRAAGRGSTCSAPASTRCCCCSRSSRRRIRRRRPYYAFSNPRARVTTQKSASTTIRSCS